MLLCLCPPSKSGVKKILEIKDICKTYQAENGEIEALKDISFKIPKGEVVGINSAKYSSSGISSQASIEGMGFAIPISDVSELIENLMNGKEDTSDAQIGIEGYMITESQSKYNNSPVGFYISKITEGKGAEQAGIEMGNIVTEIEGKKVESIESIKNVLLDKKVGDKVKLKVSYIARNQYKEKEVEVTLSK